MACKDQTSLYYGWKTDDIWGYKEVHPNPLSPLTAVPGALTSKMKTHG